MALGRIAHAMRSFPVCAEFELQRWSRSFDRLPDGHKQLLESLSSPTVYPSEWQKFVREGVRHNDMFLRMVLSWLGEEDGPWPLVHALQAADMWVDAKGGRVPPGDFEKVLYVLKNIARDWSADFKTEREASYGRIVRALARVRDERAREQGGTTGEERSPTEKMNVLVPGCGLARLCVDLVEQGFDVVGNEHSYFMLLMSAFLLNGTTVENQWTIFPWMIHTSNVLSLQDQLLPCNFPDRLPSDLVGRPGSGTMGMVAGDFCECFAHDGEKGMYDAVVTCFFLDTSHNVIQYLETIWDVLAAGGVWVHLGPLQWHWSDANMYEGNEEMSIEVGLDAVVEIAKKIGFVFEFDAREFGDERHDVDVHPGVHPDVHHAPNDSDDSDDSDASNDDLVSVSDQTSILTRLRVPYMSNRLSMRPQVYDCAFFVARKPSII